MGRCRRLLSRQLAQAQPVQAQRQLRIGTSWGWLLSVCPWGSCVPFSFHNSAAPPGGCPSAWRITGTVSTWILRAHAAAWPPGGSDAGPVCCLPLAPTLLCLLGPAHATQFRRSPHVARALLLVVRAACLVASAWVSGALPNRTCWLPQVAPSSCQAQPCW